MRLRIVGKYCLIFFVAFAFVALFSNTTSFLHPSYGNDSAVFRLIGQSLARGQELYVDIWDHKGPTLFLIQWLSQVIYPGRIGIFVMQVLFMFGTLSLLVNLAKRFLSLPGIVAVVAVFLALLTKGYQGGNLTEEYTLLFTMIVLYGVVVGLLEPERITTKWGGLMFPLMGFSLAFVFIMRANNALPIVGILIGFFVTVLLRRGPFWRPLLWSLAGFMATIAVIALWFVVRGTFSEMMYATFWFNFTYSEKSNAGLSLSGRPIIYLQGFWLAILLPILGAVVEFLKKGLKNSLAISALSVGLISGLAILVPEASFLHYLVLALPAIIFGLILALQLFRGSWVWGLAAVLVVLGFLVAREPYRLASVANVQEQTTQFVQQVQDIRLAVPADQRDQIFTWDIHSRYYLVTGELPIYRFYTMQTWWGYNDPQVYVETVQHVQATWPQWILAPTKGFGLAEMEELVNDKYQLVDENDLFMLYELR